MTGEPVSKLAVVVEADVSSATRRLNTFSKALDKVGEAARKNAADIDTALTKAGGATTRITTSYSRAGAASRALESDTGRLAAAQARAASAAGNHGAAVSAATARVNLATKGTISYYNALAQQASMQRQAERADRGRTASMASLVNTMRGAMMLGGGVAMLQQGWNFAKTGASNKAVEESFRRLAASSKISADALLENMRRAAAGTITDVELMKRANLAMVSQNDAMVAKLPQLLSIARTTAEATGRDVTEAYSRLVEGIAKAEPEILDELGIRINLTRAYAAGAKELDKTAQQLSVNEKSQIMLNEVLKQGNEMIEAMGEGSSVTATRLGELETAAGNLFDSIKVGAADAVVAVSDLWGAFFRDTAIGQAIFQLVRGGPMKAPSSGGGGFSGGSWEPKPTKAEGIGNQYIPKGQSTSGASAWDVRQGELESRNQRARTQAQRDYNYAVADTAGKIAILRGELNKLPKGSAAYYNKLTEINALQESMEKSGRKAGSAAARAAEKAAREAERDAERLEKAQEALMSEAELLEKRKAQLAANPPEVERLELVKQISDLETKIADTRLKLSRALLNDRKARPEELKRLEQARRVLESSTTSQAQKDAARLAIAEVQQDQAERRSDIAEYQRSVGGTASPAMSSTAGASSRSTMPTGAMTPISSTPNIPAGATRSSAGGGGGGGTLGVTLVNNFIVDGKTIATEITPYTLNAVLGSIRGANRSGIGREG